ncbi:MAG: hypothetical protein EXR71_14545 [Myxococcales bacterium]|nr:hypothetical protein [Myxococcales bacterium]
MLVLFTFASAATVTDLPPFLRGDVSVGYTFNRLQGKLSQHGQLSEDDLDVGERQINGHVMHYGLAFGVAPGTALFVDVPHTVYQSVEVQGWSKMVYDPATETGSYAGTVTEDDATVSKGRGVHGVWIGVKGTPFSEAFTSRRNRFTFLLEGAVRTPGDGAWFVVKDASDSGGLGTHGAGPGGVGLRAATTVSSRQGKHEPYMRLVVEDNLPVTRDILDDDGTLVLKDAEIDPANTVDAVVGAEFITGENANSGARSAVDLHLAAHWSSYQDVPTGLELPAVLLPDTGLVQQAESFELGGGAGLDVRFMKYLQWQLYGEVRYHLAQRVESPYPVYTAADTIRIVAGTSLSIRIR